MFTIPFGIPISINPFFPVVAFFLGYLWSGGNLPLSFIIMGIITFSILVHEYGHALTGKLFKQKVKISLLPLGGLTERQGKPLKAWQDFLIVLMGPLFGFMLYLVAASLLGTGPKSSLMQQILSITAVINLYWTILNLVPVIPLDGGQLLRIILQGIWGVTGLKIACIISVLIGALFMVAFIVMQDFLIAAIFAMFTFESYRLYADVKFLKEHDTDISMQRLLTKGEKAHQKGDRERSSEYYKELREKAKSGTLYNVATLRLAEMELEEERLESGYELLYPIRKELSIEGLMLFHEAAFRSGHWKESLEIGSVIYKHEPSKELAEQNAQSAKELDLDDAYKGWLRAIAQFE